MTSTIFYTWSGLADALLAMGAVRSYCKAFNTTVDVAVSEESLMPILTNAWFVRKVIHVAAGQEIDTSSYESTVDVTDVDRAVCVEAELQLRRERKAVIDAEITKVAEKLDVAEDKIQKPPEYPKLERDTPTWNKLMGYVHSIHTQLNVDFELDEHRPLMPSVPGIAERTRKWLNANRQDIRPGIPFILVQGLDWLDSYGMEFIYPDCMECIVVDDLDLSLVVGLVSHKLCAAVAGPVSGGLSYLGWAANVQLIIEFINKDVEPYWQLSRHDNAVSFKIDDADKAIMLSRSLAAIYEKRLGVEVVL